MKTTTLTSKGQLVIPKSVREALHLRPGTRFSVALEGDRIILEPTTTKTRRLSDWLPALQVRRRLTDAELNEPVEGYTHE